MVAYGAPRVTYAADTSPRDRLMALMQRLSIAPDELLVPTTDPDASHRLAAYWAARDRFLESGRYVRRASNVRAMLAEVREPLLEILRISPDFRPAYDPLLAMANALASSDASASRALLTELTRLQPSRDEASRGLAAMAPAPRDSDPAQR